MGLKHVHVCGLSKMHFLSPESCTVDNDCVGDAEASDPGHAGSSPVELLLRLLHVNRGQAEY